MRQHMREAVQCAEMGRLNKQVGIFSYHINSLIYMYIYYEFNSCWHVTEKVYFFIDLFCVFLHCRICSDFY